MKRNQFTTYSILLLAALLFGCNSSNTSNDSASAGSADVADTAGAVDNGTAGRPGVLNQMVDDADFVFSGSLKSIEYRNSNQGLPSTFATYEIDEIVKGNYSGKTFTVDFVGGFFSENGKFLRASNAPDIELNEKAVLMVQQSEDTGCALLKCYHGRYKIKGDMIIAPNDSAVLIDDGAVKFVSEDVRKSGAHDAAFKGMSSEKFMSHLRGIAAKSGKASNKLIKAVDLNVPFDSPKHLFNASPAPEIDNSVAKGASRSKQGSDFDQWEEEQVRLNAGNPVLTQAYMGQ